MPRRIYRTAELVSPDDAKVLWNATHHIHGMPADGPWRATEILDGMDEGERVGAPWDYVNDVLMVMVRGPLRDLIDPDDLTGAVHGRGLVRYATYLAACGTVWQTLRGETPNMRKMANRIRRVARAHLMGFVTDGSQPVPRTMYALRQGGI